VIHPGVSSVEVSVSSTNRIHVDSCLFACIFVWYVLLHNPVARPGLINLYVEWATSQNVVSMRAI
jgi:hypothetical protein